MAPGASPWIDVPDDWLDDKYSRHNGYRALQEYFGLKIKPDVDRADQQCSFDKLGASTVNLKGFGIEYYRRVVPLLRKLGIEKITTIPTTGPEESPEKYQFTGAYVWSFYGYTNSTMTGTLNQYIDYLKNVKKLALSKIEESAILKLTRMHHLALDFKRGEQTGKMFLLGIDEKDKPTRSIWWEGVHHNINDQSNHNEEMTELVDYLLDKIQ